MSVTEDPLDVHRNWKSVRSSAPLSPKFLIVFWQRFPVSSVPDDYLLITAFAIQSARQLQLSGLPEWMYYIRWWKNKCCINTIRGLFFGKWHYSDTWFLMFSWMITACLCIQQHKPWQTPLFAVVSTITVFSEQNESLSLWSTSIVQPHHRERSVHLIDSWECAAIKQRRIFKADYFQLPHIYFVS